MSQKKYDIAVKTGEYTDQQGQVKGRYQNVGAVIQGESGPYIIMERWFSPAGLANPDNRSNVVLSLFEPRKNGQQQQPQQQAPQQRQAQPDMQRPPAYQAPQAVDFSDDIPF